ncbi:MAG: hypothetical protein ACTHMC_02105 [Pseudobacter sp.]|uniref:hypothetical protein n=1 Tax=Pseudobacter sp. TaxID=2045420 RepID=UPI003F817B00
MAGRGDNNKHGSAGRGAANQSNQAFTGQKKTPKSNHGRQTGGKPSEPQPKQHDPSAHRDAFRKKANDRQEIW